jgi:hypothetical protein
MDVVAGVQVSSYIVGRDPTCPIPAVARRVGEP